MRNPFSQFNRAILKPLQILWEKVHALENMRGDGFVNIKRSNAGTTIGLNLTEARKRIAKKSDGGSAVRIFQVRSWAEETEDDFTTTGLYNCVELQLNEAGSFYKVVDRNGFTPYEGTTSGLAHEDYEEWVLTTVYLVGDIVEQTTAQISDPDKKVVRIYRAIEDSIDRIPKRYPEIWEDITVVVLNLSEVYPAQTYVAVPIQPKLGKADIIQGSSYVDFGGVSRVAGIDAADNVRFFKIKGAVPGTPYWALADMVYGDFGSSDLVIAQEGELNYDIVLQSRWADTSYDFTSETGTVVGHWVKGVWILNPYLIPTTVTVAAGDRINFEGLAGDTYMLYNSGTGELEMWVDSVKVTSWKQ